MPDLDWKLLLFGDRFLLDRDPPQVKSKGGIWIPPNAQAKSATGTVISVGPGRLGRGGKRIPLCISVGDRVFVKRFAGLMVNIRDKNYWVMREETDLLALIEDEKEGDLDQFSYVDRDILEPFDYGDETPDPAPLGQEDDSGW